MFGKSPGDEYRRRACASCLCGGQELRALATNEYTYSGHVDLLAINVIMLGLVARRLNTDAVLGGWHYRKALSDIDGMSMLPVVA